MKTAILFLVAGAAVWAQYPPGQYPPGGGNPPGQYPPGRYPGSGGPGIPGPRRGKTKPTTEQQKAALEQQVHLSGVLRKLDAKSLELASDDTRFILIEITPQTAQPAGMKTGDAVEIDAIHSDDGLYHAVSVKAGGAAAAEKAPAGEASRAVPGDATPSSTTSSPTTSSPTTPSPTTPPSATVQRGPLYDAGDEGPPKLKRGIPPARKRSDTSTHADPALLDDVQPIAAAASPVGTAADPRGAMIEKAREAAESFVVGLPNYVCTQVTTRYESAKHVTNWRALDVISAELVFEDGKERYQNLQINGKPSKKSPEESGAWSTGEFGTILAAIYHPGTAARFKFAKDAAVNALAASIFDYEVARERSQWKVHMPGEYILPAYSGSVWVEKSTSKTLRIEMQADKIPAAFPLDAVESAVDYEYVSLGAAKFLLPVHAEILSCFRGTNRCDKNVIDFRNYHRFSGQSDIKFNP